MNETDPLLEQRLRAWYRREIDDALRAPIELRDAVAAIPRTAPVARRSDRARLTLLAAAAIFALAGGAAVVGFLSAPRQSALLVAPSLEVQPTIAVPSSSPSTVPSAAPADAPSFVPVLAPPVQSTWQASRTMSTSRAAHTATLLDDGRVLVVGGWSMGAPLATAELWDPSTRSFSPTGSMHVPRVGQAATLLSDGRVLVVGGDGPNDLAAAASAEVWDPASGSFSPVIPTPDHRGSGLTATTLRDGRVLIVGGVKCVLRPENPPRCRVTDDLVTFLWDPTTNAFAPGPRIHYSRDWGTATLLADGRVLLIGGTGLAVDTPESAEIWDPSQDAFEVVGEPLQYRSSGLSATALPDGRVLVVGGDTGDLKRNDAWYGPLGTAELWDPASGLFQAAGAMQTVRSGHQAARLGDGTVMVIGGSAVRTKDFVDVGLRTTEIWDPASGSFHEGPSMSEGRRAFTLTELPDGSALVVGGVARTVKGEDTVDLAGAELFGPPLP